MFPLAFDLEGADVLVVGAGSVAAAKCRQLVAAGARVRVVAREVLAELPEGLNALVVREARVADLAGARLVVLATGDAACDEELSRAARASGQWVNVVDVPEYSDVYFMALHREGPVTVAVSTGGRSPALAGWLRDRLARALPVDTAGLADHLAAERRACHGRGESTVGLDWRARIEEWLATQSAERRRAR